MLEPKEILEQLNQQGLRGLPMLDHGYSYLADVQMSVYRAQARWGVVVDTLVCTSTESAHEAIRDVLYFFGSDLNRPTGFTEQSIHLRTSDGPDGATFGSEFEAYFVTSVADIRSITIRRRVVPITVDPAAYEAEGIDLLDPSRIQNFELLRWMAPRYRHLLLATDEELQAGFTTPMPLLLRLAAWRHPDLRKGERASDTETFRMLADAIAVGDPQRYRPAELPNTHWSNWPMGGTL